MALRQGWGKCNLAWTLVAPCCTYSLCLYVYFNSDSFRYFVCVPSCPSRLLPLRISMRKTYKLQAFIYNRTQMMLWSEAELYVDSKNTDNEA